MKKILLLLTIFMSCNTAFAAENTAETTNSKPPIVGKKDHEETYAERLSRAASAYREKERLKRQQDNITVFEQDFDMHFNVTPNQIKEAQKKQHELEEAAQIPVPYQGKTRSQAISLDPGSQVPIIKCYPHYVTTIRILDASGNSWPINAYMIGNQQAFSVEKPDMEPYDTIMISPSVNSGSTNMTVMLDNQDGEDPIPPVSFQLIVSPKHINTYDTVASIRVNRKGPRSSSPLPINDAENFYTDETLLAFLDGVPPKKALRMKVSDKNIDAWLMDDSVYVRSSSKIVWPAWTSSVSSGEKNGSIHAYKLPFVNSIMFSNNHMVTIEKYPDAINRAMQKQ